MSNFVPISFLTAVISPVKQDPPNFECYKHLTGYRNSPEQICDAINRRYNITIGDTSSGCTWRCDDMGDYCRRLLANTDLRPKLNSIFATTTIAMTPIALLSNLMLFGAFFLPPFRTTTFVYLRAIAVLEVIHNSIFVINWDVGFTTIIPAANWLGIFKGPVQEFTAMMKAMLSLSLAFERLLGVAFPVAYTKISSKKLLLWTFLLSAFISSSSFLILFGYTITFHTSDDNTTSYGWTLNVDFYTFHDLYWQPVTTSLRYVACILMLGLSLAIVFNLRRRNARIATMMNDDSAKRELAISRKVCRFQLIEALDITFSLICQTLSTYRLYVFCNLNDGDCTYIHHSRDINCAIATTWLTFLLDTTDIISHFGLFYLYLLFNNMFRTELKRVVKLIVMKLKKLYYRLFRTTAVVPIQHGTFG